MKSVVGAFRERVEAIGGDRNDGMTSNELVLNVIKL